MLVSKNGCAKEARLFGDHPQGPPTPTLLQDTKRMERRHVHGSARGESHGGLAKLIPPPSPVSQGRTLGRRQQAGLRRLALVTHQPFPRMSIRD